jgi:hypothetical protein
MDANDKIIWDTAYNEEYDNLVPLPTWEIITEKQYHKLSKGKRALPTIVILNEPNIDCFILVIMTTIHGLRKLLQCWFFLN